MSYVHRYVPLEVLLAQAHDGPAPPLQDHELLQLGEVIG
jgi:hypothetical protein